MNGQFDWKCWCRYLLSRIKGHRAASQIAVFIKTMVQNTIYYSFFENFILWNLLFFILNTKISLSESDVYLIFDRYCGYSIKFVTRDVRETVVNKKHYLLLSTKLPVQKVVLPSIENKKQLNWLLCEELTEDRLFHLRSTNKHKLVMTGENPCPIEIRMEERRSWYDLGNQQEEADTIIVQQVLGCAGEAHQIPVVSDETDVFVLLLHHYHQAGLDVPLIIIPQGRAIVDIKTTLSKHSQIVGNLWPAHAILGCDTVASYYGLGKGSVIKVLKAGYELSAIGNIDAPFQQVLDQGTAFISACYGIKESMDMSQTRLLVWGKKNGKGHMSSPKLAALPPTKEAFIENVKRAHFQAMLWRNLNINLPPALNPEEFGWKRDSCNRLPIPTNLPEDAKLVPDYILEMIRCGCKSETPCNSRMF